MRRIALAFLLACASAHADQERLLCPFEDQGDVRAWQYVAGKPKLVAPRTFVISPFPDDGGRWVYFGGFDANFFPALDTAWIFRASVATVLKEPKRDSKSRMPNRE